MKNAFVLGVTGPSGAGKSMVSHWLTQQGWVHLDADLFARKVMGRGSALLPQLQEAFGADVVTAQGDLDRKLLAARTYAFPDQLETLNRLTHPVILQEMEQAMHDHAQRGDDKLLLDAPLLFESGADRLCDVTLAVLAPDSIRLRRIMERDALTQEEALRRMRAQPTETYYEEHADFVIINDGNRDLETAVRVLLLKLERI